MVGHQTKLYTHKTNATILRIAEQLKSNQHLRLLNIPWNNFDDEAVQLLSNALEFNTVLEDLDISSNGVGPAGAAFVSVSLCRNTSLRSLNLGDNQIGSDGLQRQPPLLLSLHRLFGCWLALRCGAPHAAREGGTHSARGPDHFWAPSLVSILRIIILTVFSIYTIV